MNRDTFIDRCVLFTEFILVITLLAIFGAAYPDHFRTKMWEKGGAEGWNSDPEQRIYFYANYKEPPEVPLIWSQQ